MNSASKRRLFRHVFKLQDGRCFWCDRRMRRSWVPTFGEPVPARLAKLLFFADDPEKAILICWECDD